MSTDFLKFSIKIWSENRLAFLMQSVDEKLSGLKFLIANDSDFVVCFLKNNPVFSEITVSVTPPLLYAITGLPQACASMGVIPKSSFCGQIKARQC